MQTGGKNKITQEYDTERERSRKKKQEKKNKQTKNQSENKSSIEIHYQIWPNDKKNN